MQKEPRQSRCVGVQSETDSRREDWVVKVESFVSEVLKSEGRDPQTHLGIQRTRRTVS